MSESESNDQGWLRATIAGVGLTVSGIALSLVTSLLAGIVLAVLSLEPTNPAAIILVIGAAEGAYLLLGWAYAVRAKISIRVAEPGVDEMVLTVLGTAVALVFAIVALKGVGTLGMPIESAGDTGSTNVSSPNLIVSSVVLIIVAVCEEYLFRGALQQRLEQTAGDWGGLVVASILFGSIHYFNYTGSPVAILLVTGILSVVGGCFGYVYQRTNNLTAPIIMHFLYNLSLTILKINGYQFL